MIVSSTEISHNGSGVIVIKAEAVHDTTWTTINQTANNLGRHAQDVSACNRLLFTFMNNE